MSVGQQVQRAADFDVMAVDSGTNTASRRGVEILGRGQPKASFVSAAATIARASGCSLGCSAAAAQIRIVWVS